MSDVAIEKIIEMLNSTGSAGWAVLVKGQFATGFYQLFFVGLCVAATWITFHLTKNERDISDKWVPRSIVLPLATLVGVILLYFAFMNLAMPEYMAIKSLIQCR